MDIKIDSYDKMYAYNIICYCILNSVSINFSQVISPRNNDVAIVVAVIMVIIIELRALLQ